MSRRNRIVVVICIVVAAISFMGGMIYKYEDYVPLIEVDFEQAKYVYKFSMPLDKETVIYWLDWAIDYHQYYFIDEYIEGAKAGESWTLEEHYGWIDMYGKIKLLFLEFEEEWGVNE